MNKIDLTNQHFGKLLVLKESEIKKYNRTTWDCLCDCGNIIKATSDQLKRRNCISCGCAKSERLTEYNKTVEKIGKIKNEIGNKYGWLTVIEEAPQRRKDTAAWLCQCKCGNKKIISGEDLRSNRVLSCGCMKSAGEEKISKILLENNISFEREKTFETCRFPATNALLRFDFFIDNRYLLEFDGIQHFKGDIEIENRDNFKNKWAKENNIPLIRLSYKEIENLTIEKILMKEN